MVRLMFFFVLALLVVVAHTQQRNIPARSERRNPQITELPEFSEEQQVCIDNMKSCSRVAIVCCQCEEADDLYQCLGSCPNADCRDQFKDCSLDVRESGGCEGINWGNFHPNDPSETGENPDSSETGENPDSNGNEQQNPGQGHGNGNQQNPGHGQQNPGQGHGNGNQQNPGHGKQNNPGQGHGSPF